MDRKKIRISKYLLTLVLTLIIFAAGIAIGSYSTNNKFNEVDLLEQELRTETLSLETQYSILSENVCEFTDYEPFNEELFSLADKLGHMEVLLGKNDPNVLRLKEYFSLLQIRHLLLTQKMQEECGEDGNVLLYFYSNIGDCAKCEEQGYVLTYIRRNHEKVNIYYFDMNIDNPALEVIKNLYLDGEIETPILVIDGEVYQGFMDRDALEELLFSN